MNTQNEYWSAAPWIIVVSIPVCVVTTIIAFAANHVFHRSEGGPLRKFILAALVYLGAVLLLGNLREKPPSIVMSQTGLCEGRGVEAADLMLTWPQANPAYHLPRIAEDVR